MKNMLAKTSRLTKVWAVLLLIGVAATLAWAAEEKEKEEKVTLQQVPAAVKATLEQEAQGGTIKEIEKEVEHGKTVYEAEIVKGGKTTEVEVDENGKVLEREQDDDGDDD